jgi:hypothetical protein
MPYQSQNYAINGSANRSNYIDNGEKSKESLKKKNSKIKPDTLNIIKVV